MTWWIWLTKCSPQFGDVPGFADWLGFCEWTRIASGMSHEMEWRR